VPLSYKSLALSRLIHLSRSPESVPIRGNSVGAEALRGAFGEQRTVPLTGIRIWRLEDIPEDAEELPDRFVSVADAAKWVG
jgi:hypothetical protein